MRFDLIKDRKGMVWDVMLYVPTVSALLGLSAYFWFSDKAGYSYLMLFLSTFFFLTGAARIVKTRLMVWPTAPISLEIAAGKVSMVLRNGNHIDLLKDIRYYPDYSGRTFGLSGLDGSGKRLQFVFHKGQFSDDNTYQQAVKTLRDR